MLIDVIVPAAAGVIATLLGVGLGARLSHRSNVQQWARDKQIDACATVLREANRIRHELRRLSRHPEQRVDWIPWNEALAVIQLMGDHEIVASALRIDESVWRASARIEDGMVTTEDAWAAVRDPMESACVDFINTARRQLVPQGPPVRRLVARPSLAERIGKSDEGASGASPSPSDASSTPPKPSS